MSNFAIQERIQLLISQRWKKKNTKDSSFKDKYTKFKKTYFLMTFCSVELK